MCQIEIISDVPEPMGQILADLKAEGYEFRCYEKKGGQNQDSQYLAVFLGEIETEQNKLRPCDTVIYIDKVRSLEPPVDSNYAVFSTFICFGIEGKGSRSFNKAVDSFNCQHILGKLARSYNDTPGSIFYASNEEEEEWHLSSETFAPPYTLIYVTNHCTTHLTTAVVKNRLRYHALMKLKLLRDLEKHKPSNGKGLK